MKKIFVSGANGQDGSYMIEYLLKNTENFIIAGIRRTSQATLSNLKDVINHPRLVLKTVDLCDSHSISKLIKEEKPDYFINLAASSFVADSWAQPALTMEINAISLIHILEAIRNFAPNCRLYSAGSSEQWGDVKYSPQDEKHPMSPRSIYGVSKCSASHICKIYRESYGMYVVHGILTNHESERRQSHFVTRKITKGVARIFHAIKNNEKFEPIVLGNIEARRDWSHSLDFVHGIWMMINQENYNEELKSKLNEFWNTGYGIGEGQVVEFLSKNIKEYVLSSGKNHSIRDFIKIAFSRAGIEIEDVNPNKLSPFLENPNQERQINYQSKDGKPVVVVSREFYRPADVENLLGSSDLIKKELNWTPKISFEELVSRMVDNDILIFKKD